MFLLAVALFVAWCSLPVGRWVWRQGEASPLWFMVAAFAGALCVGVGLNLACPAVLLMLPAAKPTVSPAGREFTPEEIQAFRALPDSARAWLTAHGWVDPETVYSFDGAGRRVGYAPGVTAEDVPDFGPVLSVKFRPVNADEARAVRYAAAFERALKNHPR